MFGRPSVLVSALAVTAVAGVPSAAGLGEPSPLRGVPLSGPTGLRLLVPARPPYVFDADTGEVRIVRGVDVRGTPTVWTFAAGADAVVGVDRFRRGVPAADFYVVRRSSGDAVRIAVGAQAAPAGADSIWLKTYRSRQHCMLRQIGLTGRSTRRPRRIPCSARLVDAGGTALVVHGRTTSDPRTGKTLVRGREIRAIAGSVALASAEAPRPVPLIHLRTRHRWGLRWPSSIRYLDSPAVHPNGRLVAVGFADPSYRGGGTQVSDVWLLDVTTRTFTHLPDLPAEVSLKSTSMRWTVDGRLVWLGASGGQEILAVWKPGDKRIAVRPVQIPRRDAGSDSFVVWAS